MWFKNLHFYEVVEPIQSTGIDFDEKLSALAFHPALPSAPGSHGWVNPINEEFESYHYAAEGFVLFCLQVEKKLLPMSVVNAQLKEYIKKIEMRDNRKVYRKEKLALKDEVFHTFLARAFSVTKRIYACYDTSQQRLWIDTPQRNQAEFFTAFLRETLGDLKLSLPQARESMMGQLTSWLFDQHVPQGFCVNDSCILQNPKQEKGGVRILKQDLSADTVRAFITEEHFFVKEIALSWQNYLNFTIKDDFTLKQLQFSDAVHSLAKDIHTEDEIQKFASDFVVMANTLRDLLQQLDEVFEVEKVTIPHIGYNKIKTGDSDEQYSMST